MNVSYRLGLCMRACGTAPVMYYMRRAQTRMPETRWSILSIILADLIPPTNTTI